MSYDAEERGKRQERLYLLLALFDRRQGGYIDNLVQAAREGFERDGMGENGAWDVFDHLWNVATSTERLRAVKREGVR